LFLHAYFSFFPFSRFGFTQPKTRNPVPGLSFPYFITPKEKGKAKDSERRERREERGERRKKYKYPAAAKKGRA
jgi:hypothetical protein